MEISVVRSERREKILLFYLTSMHDKEILESMEKHHIRRAGNKKNQEDG